METHRLILKVGHRWLILLSLNRFHRIQHIEATSSSSSCKSRISRRPRVSLGHQVWTSWETQCIDSLCIIPIIPLIIHIMNLRHHSINREEKMAVIKWKSLEIVNHLINPIMLKIMALKIHKHCQDLPNQRKHLSQEWECSRKKQNSCKKGLNKKLTWTHRIPLIVLISKI